MGERSAGNPHAAFDVEGAGNVARPTYFGLAGSPVLDPTCERLGMKFPGPTRLNVDDNILHAVQVMRQIAADPFATLSV